MKRLAASDAINHGSPVCPRLHTSEPLDQSISQKLELIYRTERPSLLRRLVRRTGIDQAEDLVQQVFVRLAGRHDAVARIEMPQSYLAEAARNALRDGLRTASRSSAATHVPLDDVDLSGPDPVLRLEARDRLVRIEHALRRLKPLTRNVFLARRLDGYSYAEIAEQTGLSVRGVEKQMSRAIKLLARHLDDG